jgi:hypothetical protein
MQLGLAAFSDVSIHMGEPGSIGLRFFSDYKRSKIAININKAFVV